MRWRSTSTIFAGRIDSRFLLPGRRLLPHVNCYPPAELRGGGEDGEATEHGNTAGIETGSWGAPPKIVDVEHHRVLHRGGQQFLSWPSGAREPSSPDWLPAPRTPQGSGCRGSNADVRDCTRRAILRPCSAHRAGLLSAAPGFPVAVDPHAGTRAHARGEEQLVG